MENLHNELWVSDHQRGAAILSSKTTALPQKDHVIYVQMWQKCEATKTRGSKQQTQRKISNNATALKMLSLPHQPSQLRAVTLAAKRFPRFRKGVAQSYYSFLTPGISQIVNRFPPLNTHKSYKMKQCKQARHVSFVKASWKSLIRPHEKGWIPSYRCLRLHSDTRVKENMYSRYPVSSKWV